MCTEKARRSFRRRGDESGMNQDERRSFLIQELLKGNVQYRDMKDLWQGDITTLRCDAIVNAANSVFPLGSFISLMIRRRKSQ